MQKKIIIVLLYFYSSLAYSLGFSIFSSVNYDDFTSKIITITNDHHYCDKDEFCLVNNNHVPTLEYDFFLNGNLIDYLKIKTANNFSKYLIRGKIYSGRNFFNVNISTLNKSNSNILQVPYSDSWFNDTEINIKGVEPNVIKHLDKYFIFFRGNSDINHAKKIINYGDRGVIKFAQSNDGINWTEPVDLIPCSSCYQGQPFVFNDDRGFHLIFNDGYADGLHNYQYWLSDTGLPGTFKLIEKNFLRVNFYPGNISVHKGENKYHIFYESLYLNKFWALSKIDAVNLSSIVDLNSKPIINHNNKMIGGPEIFKIDNVYYMIAHQGEDFGEGNMPTSIVRYRSMDLVRWHKESWELLREGVSGIESQIADPSIIHEPNRLVMYYEELHSQAPNKLPNIRRVTVNKSPKLFYNSKYTRTRGSDLKSEGWVYDEHDPVNLGSIFRKSARLSTKISDNALLVKTRNKAINVSYPINLDNKELYFTYKNNNLIDGNTIINFNDNLISLVNFGKQLVIKNGINTVPLCVINNSDNAIRVDIYENYIFFNCLDSRVEVNIQKQKNITKFGFNQLKNQISVYSGFIVKEIFKGVNYETTD